MHWGDPLAQTKQTRDTEISNKEFYCISNKITRKDFTISSSLVSFLQACDMLLCLCLIHFCLPRALHPPGHISMECRLRSVWILNNLPKVMRLIRKKKRKEKGKQPFYPLSHVVIVFLLGLPALFKLLFVPLLIKSTRTAMGRSQGPLVFPKLLLGMTTWSCSDLFQNSYSSP